MIKAPAPSESKIEGRQSGACDQARDQGHNGHMNMGLLAYFALNRRLALKPGGTRVSKVRVIP